MYLKYSLNILVFIFKYLLVSGAGTIFHEKGGQNIKKNTTIIIYLFLIDN